MEEERRKSRHNRSIPSDQIKKMSNLHCETVEPTLSYLFSVICKKNYTETQPL